MAREDQREADSFQALQPDRRVLGRFRLERELGRGGMGVVWRAHDEVLAGTVALKFVPDVVARDDVAIDELKQETRRAHRLTHPHIVRIHDFLQQEGLAAISMECVDGATLTALRLAQPGRLFGVEALTPLVAQLCSALQYAHGIAKTVHRDLKPANLLVAGGSELKVADFGISRSLVETHTRLTLPQQGGAVGTLPYMSPQQLLGDKPEITDDIYALGATLYELLAGEPPFYRGDLHAVMMQIRERPPVSISEKRTALGLKGGPVPAIWESAIMACLEKDPSSRPAEALEVADRLGLPRDASSLSHPDRPSGKRHAGRSSPPRNVAAPKKVEAGERSRLARFAMAAVAIVALAAIPIWKTWDPTEAASRLHEPSAQKSPPSVPARPAVLPKTAPREAELPTAKPLPREFTVTVTPEQTHARLWLDRYSDHAVGSGQTVLRDLADGEHELTVQATGFVPFSTRVQVRDGRGSASVVLLPIVSTLQVVARVNTTVTATDDQGVKIPLGTVGPGGVLEAREITVGTYSLTLAHPDCAAVEVKGVTIATGRAPRIAPTQVPLPANLAVTSTPPGAEVRINDVVVGRTPTEIRDQPSEQSLRVSAYLAGYRTIERTVRLSPRTTLPVDLGTLQRELGSIAVAFSDREFPAGDALAKIDGQTVPVRREGNKWTIERQPSGSRKLEIVHSGYNPWSQDVEVVADQMAQVSAAPVGKPAMLMLSVTGPSQYAMTLNRSAVVPTDGRIAVPSREPIVMTFRSAGFRPAVGALTIPAGVTKTLSVPLEPQSRPAAGKSHENSLRLRFVPIPGTRLLISIWETRAQDIELHRYLSSGSTVSAGGTNEPGTKVTWQEAVDFCAWLTRWEQEDGNLGPGESYRLPSDLEWSTAAGLLQEKGATPAERNRGIKGYYPWGTAWPPPAGAGNLPGAEVGGLLPSISQYRDPFEKRAPVGSFAPNRLGIHDLAGNVWEWCQDEFAPGSGLRVIRGGSFDEHRQNMLLTSAREGRAPTTAAVNIGFRCVLDLGRPK